MTSTRRQLEDDGFCIIEGALDEACIEHLRAVTDRILDDHGTEHFEDQRSTGSMISVCSDPSMAELVVAPEVLATFCELGFPSPTWFGGFVISKSAGGPPLFWHQDWWGWDDDCSYRDPVLQTFMMVYLVDTDRDNGCLRVIPRSHLHRTDLHDKLDAAHDEAIRRYENPEAAAFQPAAGELDVPVRAGDLVLGDARLLHVAHANRSKQRRTVITLWYFPQFDRLPEVIRARVVEASGPLSDGWAGPAGPRLEPFLPRYDGKVAPIAWNRIPGTRLR